MSVEDEQHLPVGKQSYNQWISWGIIAGFVAYMVILPTVYWVIEQSTPRKNVEIIEDLTLIDMARIKSVELATGAMFFALGASVGSFLNVVVYRMPRGLSVLFKSSFCPQCTSKIKSTDNIPVFGWIWLKGCCRNCKLPIPLRYPVVELTMGLIVLLFFFVELISGGINLPVRFIEHYKGVVWILLYPKWDLIGLYVVHMLMFATLLTWSLIHKDQQRIPFYSFITGWAGLSLPGIFWPELYLIKSNIDVNWLHLLVQKQQGVLWGVILGTGMGALIYGVVRVLRVLFPIQKLQPLIDHESFAFSLCLVGAALGWQACLSISLLYCVVTCLLIILTSSDRLVHIAPYIFMSCTISHHLCWRYIVQFLFSGIV